jgi:hypothetical protein
MNTTVKYTAMAALMSILVMQSCHQSENTTVKTVAKSMPLVKFLIVNHNKVVSDSSFY